MEDDFPITIRHTVGGADIEAATISEKIG